MALYSGLHYVNSAGDYTFNMILVPTQTFHNFDIKKSFENDEEDDDIKELTSVEVPFYGNDHFEDAFSFSSIYICKIDSKFYYSNLDGSFDEIDIHNHYRMNVE